MKPIAREEWDDIELLLDRRALEGPTDRSCAQTRNDIRGTRLAYVDVEFERADVEKNYGLSLLGAA